LHRGPGQPLHHEERPAIAIDPQIVYRHHGRVLQTPLDAGLAHEARQLLRRRLGRPDPLDGDVAPDVLVVGEQDLPHPALAQDLAEAIPRAIGDRKQLDVPTAGGWAFAPGHVRMIDHRGPWYVSRV
jgi:hypothetical protein